MTSYPETTSLTNKVVQTTTNYDHFTLLVGNRPINKVHLHNLRKSIEKKYLFTVVIVNEKNQIIDGQHRFYVIRDLKLPLNYIVCEGYGLNEVHTLNQNSSSWDAEDFMNGYADMGLNDYIIYRDFKNRYKLGHQETMTVLGGKSYNNLKNDFSDGFFKVKSLTEAEKIIQTIFRVEPYYPGYKRRFFINAMFQLLKHPDFDFEEFVRKLKLQPTAMKDCTSTDNYREHIEEIYNYKRREKVNLRF